MNDLLPMIFLVIGAGVGTAAVIFAFRRRHGQMSAKVPLIGMVVGLAFIAASYAAFAAVPGDPDVRDFYAQYWVTPLILAVVLALLFTVAIRGARVPTDK